MNSDKIKQAAEEYCGQEEEYIGQQAEEAFEAGAQFILDQASEGVNDYMSKDDHASWFSDEFNKQAARHCWQAATISADKRHEARTKALEAELLRAFVFLGEISIRGNPTIDLPLAKELAKRGKG